MARAAVATAFVTTCFLVLTGSNSSPKTEMGCTPAYFELDRPVIISLGDSELSFRLLAVGCRESLVEVWPPPQELLEREFQPALQEPHPVQTLLMIRDRSPELRARLVAALNERVLKRPVVYDVFIYDARAAEGL